MKVPIREDLKNSKINDIYQKGGWGQNFMKTIFFFEIVTLGGGRTLYDTISLSYFFPFQSIFSTFAW